MPALFFPNLDTLRLVLASGVIPPDVSDAPARAGFDAHSRLWLEPTELPHRDALTAIARLGVRALGDAGVPTAPIACWAELLPLRPARRGSTDVPGIVLFDVPDSKLARFAAT